MKRNWSVNSALPVHYNVQLVDRVLDLDNLALLEAGASQSRKSTRRIVVVDATVEALYGSRIRAYLLHHGVTHKLIKLSVSETEKTMDLVLRVAEAIDDFGISRRHEPIIAIGGGVLLDVVGLAASLYRRNTPYVRIPTTLIGLVDAGVGAKTGVNHGLHKNRLGTYFPARTTLLDRSFLRTLDARQIRNGLAEILKIALIKDWSLFELLDQHGPMLVDERMQGASPDSAHAAGQIIERAVTGMLDELELNLWEHKLERVVDFGHSFSPTIEMLALPELLHGEAVNIDMALTTILSAQRGLIGSADRDRIFGLMRKLHLPIHHALCCGAVLEDALASTTAHRDGLQRLPLGMSIGSACFVNDLKQAELTSAAAALQAMDAELPWLGERATRPDQLRASHA
jgi:3-dehydroquinate synthetase